MKESGSIRGVQGWVMSRVRVASLMVIALLLVSPLAWGAGFDCARAKEGVEQRICNDTQLSQLDEQLTQSFDRARTRAGQHLDALLRDQRNWLAERNQVGTFNPSTLSDEYQERIAFINRLFIPNNNLSPLLQSVFDFVMSNQRAKYDADGGYVNLGGGTIFSEVVRQDLNSSNVDSFGIPALKDLLQEDEGYPSLYLFSQERLGVISYEAGTAICYSWSTFSWKTGKVQLIDTPASLQDGCTDGYSNSELAEYKGVAYAISTSYLPARSSDFQVQPFINDAWGTAQSLTVEYDVTFGPPDVACSSMNCDGLDVVAERMAKYYDQNSDFTPYVSKLSRANKAAFAALSEKAKRDRTLLFIPTFDRKPDYRYSEFGDNASWFPVEYKGALLLGRIANGQAGSHMGFDWIIGIWRWDGSAFVPVLGMVEYRNRGHAILAEQVPNP
jgi:uncharacterized protein YecT (DUF1311 family)